MKKINSFYPTLGMSWAVIGVFIGCTLVVAILGGVLLLMPGLALNGNAWVALFSYILPFVGVAGFIYSLQRYEQTDNIATPVKHLSILLFFLLALFTPLLSFITEPLTSWLPMPDFLKDAMNALFQKNLPAFLMAVVAAPFCEEWLCRGVIMRGLLKHSSPQKAILWSSFIFALIHMNPWQAVPAFIIGLLLGFVYWKTRSLWPCIFIHFINNGLSFATMYLFPDTDVSVSSQDLIGENYWLIYVGAILLAAPIGYWIYRLLSEKPQESMVSDDFSR